MSEVYQIVASKGFGFAIERPHAVSMLSVERASTGYLVVKLLVFRWREVWEAVAYVPDLIS